MNSTAAPQTFRSILREVFVRRMSKRTFGRSVMGCARSATACTKTVSGAQHHGRVHEWQRCIGWTHGQLSKHRIGGVPS